MGESTPEGWPDAARVAASINALLDEAEKAQRKGHLVLADTCREASDLLGLMQHRGVLIGTPGLLTVNCVRGTVRCTERERIQGYVEAFRREETRADRLDEALDTARDALHRVKQWADAYPEDIFPPVDIKAVRERFGDDALFSRLHAEWARHIMQGIGGIVGPALAAKEHGHE